MFFSSLYTMYAWSVYFFELCAYLGSFCCHCTLQNWYINRHTMMLASTSCACMGISGIVVKQHTFKWIIFLSQWTWSFLTMNLIITYAMHTCTRNGIYNTNWWVCMNCVIIMPIIFSSKEFCLPLPQDRWKMSKDLD